MIDKETLKFGGSLHNHTDYSNLRLRDSINRYDTLIDYAIELGHEVIAITEHESISNAVKIEKYYKKIKEEHPNFKVILGNEIYLCRDGLNKDNFKKGRDKYYHFILLAKDAEGHRQIRELSTRAYKRSYKTGKMRRVPTYYQDLIEVIGTNPGHVIGSTACLGGTLPTQLIRYRDANLSDSDKNNYYELILKWCRQLKDLFGEDNFYLEMQPSLDKDQIYVNKEIIKISKLLDIPYIITTDSHYLKKEDASIHEAYLNAQNGDREVRSFYATTYMMSTEELESYMLKSLSFEEIQIAYQNIHHIKESCQDYSLLKPLRIPDLKWKKHQSKLTEEERAYYRQFFPSIINFENSTYKGDKVLVEAIYDALDLREEFRNQKTYDAIEDNLSATWKSSVKNNAHWSAYYLNLQNIIDICWEAGTLVGPGRGSGVGFFLLYLFDITQINPLWEDTATFSWRFLNPDRVSVLDIDVDIEGSKRTQVLKALRSYYGEDNVANVATFRTEKSKAAILTAARGLKIDVDTAQYLAGLIPSDRGQTRTLNQCFYGDEEAGFTPIKSFVEEMTNNYPELWEVAQRIEGLVCGLGVHAGGVIFVDEPFTNSTALMRAPDGTIITAFDLHDAEDCSLIKYDLLSVECLDRMHNCIDLICDCGYFKREDTLKATYEKMIGIYNIERTEPKMWEMVWNHQILSLFQMEQQSGIQGIALTHPKSVDELAVLNSVIRLMAQEKGAEQPLNKFARFKENPQAWVNEMNYYGLSEKEQELLRPILKISYGICESQEKFMQLVQIPECGGVNLDFADRLRKAIAKKKPKEYDALTKEYFEKVEEKHLSRPLCEYVWNVLVATSRGYGFNASHTLAYSLIALQEMNLAYNFPIEFWNCACLITESGGNEEEEDDEENVYNEIDENSYSNEIIDFDEEDEDEEEEDSDETSKKDDKKKKAKVNNYGKIATAIGKMKMANITIAPPDINKSQYTFSPDYKNHIIRYGLSGITSIGKELIEEIIKNRPYKDLNDFLSKVKINKPKMINLIKCGAFDFLGDRKDILYNYIVSISDVKKCLNLRNFKGLKENGFLNDYQFEIAVWDFNNYLKNFKQDKYFILDNTAQDFYNRFFDVDKLVYIENDCMIEQNIWKKIYTKTMEPVRQYLKDNQQEILSLYNNKIIEQNWKKYCSGNISKWEMDSISYYNHEHELAKLNYYQYNISNFFDLPEEPVIENSFPAKDTGQMIHLFKIERIAGTVLDKNKNKNMITLLTREGVVNVKIFGDVFTKYDKQISFKNEETGKKTVIEKSWFKRGNKIIVTGIRRGDMFIGKKYKSTPYHFIELIEEVNEDGTAITRGERLEV